MPPRLPRPLVLFATALVVLGLLGHPANAGNHQGGQGGGPTLTSVCEDEADAYTLFNIEADDQVALTYASSPDDEPPALGAYVPVGPLQAKNGNRFEAWVGVPFGATLYVMDESGGISTKAANGNDGRSCIQAGTFTWTPVCGEAGAFDWRLTFEPAEGGGPGNGAIAAGALFVDFGDLHSGRIFITTPATNQLSGGVLFDSMSGSDVHLHLTGLGTGIVVASGSAAQAECGDQGGDGDQGGAEEICDNLIDDDDDGLTDGADPDCPPTPTPEVCDDEVDNDLDGLIDSADPDCAPTPTPEVCDDEVDNDLDGLTDGADPDCAPTPTPEVCDDQVDNDLDGLIDGADPDCAPLVVPVPPAGDTVVDDPPVPPADDPADDDPPLPPAQVPAEVERVGGDDRIETAILVSESLFGPGGAAAVVLARSDIPADAIASTPFSVAVDAPVLLTPPGSLDPRVAEEIQRVLAPGGTVYIAGGTEAISADVELAVQAIATQTERLHGPNRFATATQIADRLYGMSGFAAVYQQMAGTTVLLADGEGFQDASVAGPAGAALRSAVLLTAGATMPAETAVWLADHPVFLPVAIGAAAIAAAPGAEAVGGSDPHATSVAVAERFFTDPDVAGLATSVAFPDPLVGGVDIAHRGGPLLLSQADQLPASVATWVAANAATLELVRMYGGVQALGPAVEDALSLALGG